MRAPDSIAGRLMGSLALVAIASTLLLFVFVTFEYRISILELIKAGAYYELYEHVVVPLVVLALPMAIAGRWAIRQAVRPLEVAAGKIGAIEGKARGMRVDAASLPREARPFADAVNILLERVDNVAALHEAFAADIAHELRTPLTLLSLQLDQMEGEKAAQLRLDVAAMRRLIDQLMLLAQIDAEQAAHISPAPVDLVELAEEVVAQMAPAALREGKIIELSGDKAGMIPGRREAIGAALRNLVENALRVTPTDVPVTVLADRPGELAIRDGGAGLSPERLEALAQRLRRADNASLNGAGLGLAIVARIMAAHGGRLVTDPGQRELRLIFPMN